MAQGAGYAVKSIEPVAIGSDVQVCLFTLALNETIPWHFHSSVSLHEPEAIIGDGSNQP